MIAGRPIRFLSCVTGSWIAIRVLVLWSETGSLPRAIREALPLPPALAAALPVPHAAPATAGHSVTLAVPARMLATGTAPLRPVGADPVRVQFALLAATRFDTALGEASPMIASTGTESQAALPPPRLQVRTQPLAAASSRLSFSSWLIARDGVGVGSSLSAPQLGGAQGGIRADYAIGGNFALTGRLASPAAGAGREGALGIAWRPAGSPVRLVAEQRIALDGGRGGPALGISGGVSELPLAAGFRLDGYAQGGAILRGAILRGGLDRYVDAAVRAARPIAQAGGVTIDAGAGAWGGAQRGVARIDLGPSVGARVPLGSRTLRVSLDWRQRVAGTARPGSGPALSLGSDF